MTAVVYTATMRIAEAREWVQEAARTRCRELGMDVTNEGGNAVLIFAHPLEVLELWKWCARFGLSLHVEALQ